jgi:hypothetical protein
MMRVKLQIGDVFEVSLGNGKVGYFQYIADDETQLDSHVIRAFQENYDETDAPAMSDVVLGRLDFYAHVFLKTGLKFGFWKKVGNAAPPDKVGVIFRASEDYGRPEIKVSHRWYVWRINEAVRNIGVLAPEYHEAELGPVVAPMNVLERMRTGSYGIVYPGY